MRRSAIVTLAVALLVSVGACSERQTRRYEPERQSTTTTATTASAVDWNSRYRGVIPVHDISERGSWLVAETDLHASTDGNQVYGMGAQVCFDALSMGWSGRVQVLDAQNRVIAQSTTMPNGNTTCVGNQ